ncbi:SDR family oxidoreductase [Patulibacter sp. NPDC049589]|uniref:SDR family NAD(P)-dependent oxidoreductase n=1 Tax=Patulibacter sp. NPDC049589 TaxID=3154731 RepID=UPI003413981B
MLLQGKNAIVYGTGGLGAGVARAFAAEGARVFVAGRTARAVLGVVAAITADGGTAEGTILDVLDEDAVEEHVAHVVAEAGTVDVSLNLTSREDRQGTPLIEMDVEALTRGPRTALTAQFVTARAAARRMVAQGSGAILAVTSGTARSPSAGMGNTGPADAAVEVLLRTLAAEVGPSGVRVVGVHTAAVAETLSRERILEVSGQDVDPADVVRAVAGRATLRRAPVLADVAGTLAFLASDRAAGITGTTVNVTCGLVAD